MDIDVSLNEFGIRIEIDAVGPIREILEAETQKEAKSQGKGDTQLMRLCCVQLFSLGLLDDVLRIWQAKNSSMDAASAIDVRLLCGAGLKPTIEYLQSIEDSSQATEALAYIEECKAAGDFDGFDPEEVLAQNEQYYL